MRCLYCGKELALLKRLTGGGEFCSEAHKQSYQEEYNRLALSRLLQAQKKKGQQANAPAQTGAPPAAAVAVEESAPAPQPESPVAVREVEQSAAASPATEPPPEAAPGAPAEPEPVQLADFLLDLPLLAASAEPEPYQEPQLELAPSPALSKWQAENPGSFQLSQANLQALDWVLNAPCIGERTPSADLSAPPWPSARPHPIVSSPVASSAATSNRTATNRLASGGAISIEVVPLAGDPASDPTFVHPVEFERAILFSESEFLELSPTSIEFPAEDAGVVVLERSHPASQDGSRDLPIEDTTPRSSLEALSRLHQEMIEEQEAQALPEDVPPEEAAPIESVAAAPDVATPPAAPAPPVVPPEVIAVEVSPAAEPASGPLTIDIVADNVVVANVLTDDPEHAEQESRPPFRTELLEISLRIFPPSKATPLASDLLPALPTPLLPHLKALPLRPKVALARGYAPGAPASAGTPATAAVTPRKPAPRPLPAKSSAPPAKPAVQPAPPRQPAPVANAAAPPIEKSSPVQPPPSIQEVKVQEVKIPEVGKNEPVTNPLEPAKPAVQIKPGPSKPEPGKPEPGEPEPAKSESRKSESLRPEPVQPAPIRSASVKKEDVPSFGIAQSANVPWSGSLKVKLGIAIVLLLIACIYFLGWGSGKSHRPASSNPASGDASGPSIILGEGGWVEGWGGDPAGMRVGRQITIYRPSLKLSDYRIEFQATIDVKSIGWVFRAANPENYYAMKIATVSTSLPLKVALFKYLVANGKQTQVGRVPIDMAIQPDTAFNIREDVRGPHFTTYIQGQQVDSWTDDQLKVGGVGFLNERAERGKVSSVSIRYLTGGK